MILFLVIVSIVQFWGDLIYVRNALLGKSQPNRITFFLGGLVPMIAVAIGLSVGQGWALLPVFMVGFGPLLIFIASFFNPKAYWKLGSLDYLSAVLAVLALVLWLFFRQTGTAVIFAILSDLFIWLPTLFKSWKYPETETGIGYVVAVLSAIIGVAILQSYDFINSGFLFYTVLINACLSFSVYRKHPLKKFQREFSSVSKNLEG